MKKKSKIILIVIACLILIPLLSFGGLNLYCLLTTPKTYIVDAPIDIQYQYGYECPAFSSSLVLRSYGEDIDAMPFYNSLEPKNSDGSVPTKVLLEAVESKGYKMKPMSGTLLMLKHEVSKGKPVVVLIHIYKDSELLHYVPVVGYDEDYIYLADSVQAFTNVRDEKYNRKIATDEFMDMWDCGMTSRNAYFPITKK